MTFRISFLLLFIAAQLGAAAQTSQYRLNFDEKWKFELQAKPGFESSGFDDKNWRTLNLPHDWTIEGSYSPDNGGDWQSGYLPGGVGVYRKTFPYSKDWDGKKVSITFEGVYMNSEVWINGHSLGVRPNGYVGFTYDLSPYLNTGKNVIAVKVDHSKPLSGRWYTGSGIYRHVWLNIDPVTHIDREHSFYDAKVNADRSVNARFEIAVKAAGDGSSMGMMSSIYDQKGNRVSVKEVRGGRQENGRVYFEASHQIPNADLWSPDSPNLYTAKFSVYKAGKLVDEYTLKPGFRKLEFSGKDGFTLNGVNTKIKGVCLHQDAGLFGVAVPDEVWEKRLKQLKDMGVNAIRTSHHPFSPTFYNLCDSLGMMVMNEAFDGWEKPKARDDYGNYFDQWWEKDLTDFVLRDRNHPSVIMWSIGNEVPKPLAEIQKKLIDVIHKLDPQGRPVTQGGVDPTRGMSDKKERTQLDVKGFNGDGEEIGTYEKFHAEFPEVPMIGTEVPHTYQTRGVYKTQTHWRRRDFPAPWEINSKQAGQLGNLKDKIFPIADLAAKEVFPEEKVSHYFKNDSVLKIPNTNPWAADLYYQSSYDNASVRSSARKAWQRTLELPYVMGQFRWTGFDYLGESNQWPSRFANFGVIDLAGFPKDHFYLYQSLWTDKPMVHLLPHWTHPGKEGIEIPVVVYTNCESAELFLNGKSLGMKKYSGEQLQWDVAYVPGVLKVIAYNQGKQVSEKEYRTAGKASGISVKTDKKELSANSKEVLFLEIDLVDKNGVPVPGASNKLNFKVSGPAVIRGSDNGDPLDLSDYRNNYRRAFRGKCLLVLQSTDQAGQINVEISGEGLKTFQLSIPSRRMK